jgi:hypothetical protein
MVEVHRIPQAQIAGPRFPTIVSGRAVAWRTWELCPGRSSMRLSSYRGPRWPLDRPLRATCRWWAPGASPRPHRSPRSGCTCGIHARLQAADFRHPWVHLRDSGPPGAPLAGPGVFGSLTLSGRIVRYSRGYRAERARPKRIILACTSCWILGDEVREAVIVEHEEATSHALQPRCAVHLRSRRGPDARAVLRRLVRAYGIEALPFDEYRDAVCGPALVSGPDSRAGRP